VTYMTRGMPTRTAYLTVNCTIFMLLVWRCCAITTATEANIVAARARAAAKANGESLFSKHVLVHSSLVF